MVRNIEEIKILNNNLCVYAGTEYTKKDAKALADDENNKSVKITINEAYAINLKDPEWWDNPFSPKYKKSSVRRILNLKEEFHDDKIEGVELLKCKVIENWKTKCLFVNFPDWKFEKVGNLDSPVFMNNCGYVGTVMASSFYAKDSKIGEVYADNVVADNCVFSEIFSDKKNLKDCYIFPKECEEQER